MFQPGECQSAPPPFNNGGVDVTAIGNWVQIGEEWYRWLGRNTVLLGAAIEDAHLFKAAEWVKLVGGHLRLYVP